MKYLTDREIHVLGIQRTGQHAVTSWLIGHFERVCFINGLSTYEVPSRATRGVHPPYWYFEPQVRDKWESSNDNPIRRGQDAIIIGTEWYKPALMLNPQIDKQKDNRVQEFKADAFSKRQDYIMVLRSPYNHYASVLKWHRCRQLKNPSRFLRCWKNFANELLGNTDEIPNPKTFIRYDEWFLSKDYRMAIAKSLDLEFTDKRINTVMRIGVGKKYGSSFDEMKMKSQAQQMNVLERWKPYKDNKNFQMVMKDEELRELSKHIFGELPKELR